MKVGIIGATGYGGAELYRILLNHPKVENCILYSSSEANTLYTDSFPHLSEISNHVLQGIDIEEIKKNIDVLFLATPAGVSAEITPKLINSNVKIIDLSGDLRIKNRADYEKWYKREAVEQPVLDEAIYGLPELNREEIKKAKLIANPGCFPTATILGLAPIVQGNIIKESSIIVDAKSGVSGAGRGSSRATSYSEINENMKIYKVHEHQHVPEIEQALKRLNESVEAISFSTHLIPMTRGIMSTIYADLKRDITDEELHEFYKQFYKESPFVRVRPLNQYPATKEVYGSNFCDIAVKVDERTKRVTIVSVIDNLMKGAAGQAVQNFNIINGFEENTGLYLAPLFP
ncbi:N-acetyl-gamma-glutamyl-phosphate reductase [Metabacillus fastidiosus]|uniref:N-acetyl-gamma-glutamyl-phosphate reductase n=1 Tax=Metabacillus fastidiosus TaxID=1458 RepID=A0ABU6P3S9_9BACI|nr:N-acetyl-gamma-glutamyl-phosphate reductase [Metabacillus fastidiosus]MED4403164.1 N-acetyl-gamma-glutamyl-phosphate reductase [Metabacillus fastidiosus]MED4455398.1 N-acetyl-gamma-glutamyl-phosphate reductase [Metabacillus fastidiosus]MED4461589.1 N-acetyl-gamma-glutamyl-phosphate reductase [Metabacillus fastidiosus]